jgi:microcystin degradation protein MlrC
MRLLLAMFKHETNTFSPVPTPFQRFFRGSEDALCGEQAIRAYTGTGSGLGGFLEVASANNAQVIVPVAAEASPSGVVDDQTYERISELILGELAKGGFDGVLLDLHGAMVTQSHEDGEGHLLQRIREIDSRVPVGVALDMHANLYAEMVKNATVLCGYHTYPHVDMRETGVRAADVLIKAIAGKFHPVMAWGRRPMLPHIMCQGTHAEPNRSLQERCRELESEGVLAASLFTGFPHADIPNAGLGAVVCTDADSPLAEQSCNELLERAWAGRERFVFSIEPLALSVARASRMTQGPVVMLDHFDNCASGGTMDTTTVLAEVLAQGLRDSVFYAIYDPEAAALAAGAGVGNKVTLDLGGKMAMPALPVSSPSLRLTATVKFVFDGVYRNLGPMRKGLLNNTGTTVVLESAGVEIVVISRHQEPYDMSCLLSAGIDPSKKRYVILKSRVHWRAGMGGLAREVVECAGTGVATSDYSQLQFRRVQRPVYPLDAL